MDPNMPWGRGVLKPGGSLVMKLLQGTGGCWLGLVAGACWFRTWHVPGLIVNRQCMPGVLERRLG